MKTLSTLIIVLSFSFLNGQKLFVEVGGSDTGDCQGSPCESIAYALSKAIVNDSIIIGVGTYDIPQLIINNDVTIIGENKSSTILRPIMDTGSSSDSRGLIIVEASTVLDLKDLTIDGMPYLVHQAFRIKGQGNFDNVCFKNILFNESGPTYAGTAIAAFGDGPVNVRNSSFENIGRVGILYFGTGVNGSIFENNTYMGKGDGNWLDYGVELGAGAVATIDKNNISNNKGIATVDNSTSAGILLTTTFGDGTSANITCNSIFDNRNGIVVGTHSDPSLVTATNNHFEGNENFGIASASSASQVSALNNYWGSNYGPSGEGPGTGDRVDEDVLFTPFLTSVPGCTLPAPIPTLSFWGLLILGLVFIITARVLFMSNNKLVYLFIK